MEHSRHADEKLYVDTLVERATSLRSTP